MRLAIQFSYVRRRSLRAQKRSLAMLNCRSFDLNGCNKF